ncbi:SAM-dependent methyltransferase [Bdellovibrionota bacterium FG-1]
MPSLPRSPFIFAVCQVGAEAALKKEWARLRPDLRFAYSRPGFVTFKASASGKSPTEFSASLTIESVFARAYGLSFGKVNATEMPQIVAFARQLTSITGKRLRLHAWERDQYFPGDEPLGFVRDVWNETQCSALRAIAEFDAYSKLFAADSTAESDDLVLDLVAVEPDEFWYGFHLHAPSHSPVPGGKYKIELPPNAPSRAFIKIEEALRWSKIPLQAGDTAVEIGSAPGGASFALLKRGLQVIGIDPGQMDPGVLKHPRFQHIKKPVSQVSREELPHSVQWLLLDMNSEPSLTLAAAERVVSMLEDSLFGTVFTLKLNQWKVADQIPVMLERIKSWQTIKIRATQLASNRQEIVVVGFRRLLQKSRGHH